ncbi:TonB-dependent receptor [Pedobacter sp. SD-b]|uniref:TonB-dependent receptor n=1 Tax=Pedobacter segetis TaxID=2793069 RepID=A0ABS1BHB6_9SPHI|nr:TonB-dependent receptor [Pedobacter segetis]MBK0382259.1 TonB-dependent receptor [Pedobacter segetis]
MKRILTIFIFLCMAISYGHAQTNARISGVVKDEKGLPLPGVTILIKNSQIGTTSNVNGEYSLNAPKNSTLVFSFLGFSSQEINIGEKTTLNVTLKEDISKLDEVVVIGYGSVKRKNLNYATSEVSAKSIEDRPITSLQQAIQGRAAGVTVIQPSGKPGAGLNLRVRGYGSLNGSNDPLYVVDGVQLLSNDGINPNDIENITILKDASATAIYGANGANGVVLITTKSGSANKTQISVESYYGFQNVTKKLDVLNAKQFATLINEERTNVGQAPFITDVSNLPYNTNWQDEIYRRGAQQNYQLSATGGSEKYKYYLSGGWNAEDGTLAPASFGRYSIRFNQSANLYPKLKVGSNFAISRVNSVDVADNNRVNQAGVVLSALSTPPTIPVQNADGTYPQNPYQALENPVAITRGADNTSFTNKILGNVYAEYQLPADLKIRSTFGVEANDNRSDSFIDPFTTGNGRALKGFASAGSNNEVIWQNENILSYNHTFNKKHSLDAIGGVTFRKSNYTGTFLSGKNFANGSIKTVNGASQKIDASSNNSGWAYLSYLARVIYTYNDKYTVTGSFRADGSSRFGPNQKYGYFPAASVGWLISEEDFLKNVSWLSSLKLRYGIGSNGNSTGIGDFSYLARYGVGYNYPINGNTQPGSISTSIANNDLKWEVNTTNNLGLDISLFNNRISLSADAYYRKTTDALVNRPLPSQTGYGSITQNVGSLENKGLEFSLNTINYSHKNFTWQTDVEFSLNRNKVLNILGQSIMAGGVGDNGNSTITEEGQPISSFYGYISDGVDPATGNIKYRDLNKDNKITDADRTIIGNPNPKFQGGITNRFSAFGFDLSFLFQGVYGNDVYNASRIETEGMSGPKNASTAVLNRWTTPGQITDIPRAAFGDPNQNSLRNSTRFLEDGSFLKLRDLTFGYNLTSVLKKQSVLKSARIYISGRNLLTISNYKGYDPEVSREGANPFALGIDYGTYPQVRTLVFGLNAKF